MSGGISAIANLQGKVSSAHALVVTLDGGAAAMTSATITSAGIGTTSTDALVLTNTTDAAAGAQQMSGRIRFNASGWKTDATAGAQDVDVINELLPVQGTSAPTANLLWKYAVNGGAYATIATLSSAGALTLGASGFVSWTGKNNLTAPADAQYNFSNAAVTTGVGFDVGTDAVLKIRTRAQSAYATIDVLGLKASGAAGASFGPGLPTSITVVNGIVTAIS